MPFENLNFLAVWTAAIANSIIGMLWYSPLFFGKVWMRLVRRTPAELKGNARGLIFSFIGALLSAAALAVFINYAGAITAGQGATVAVIAWLGFVATSTFTAVVYEDRPLALYLINNLYFLAAFVVMGVILAVW